ncbi:MAG: hypothetical protein EKK64_06730 [Neisseriaceae bacterium]|nr:MAG: hypothetical protein EKK64_06730 [Neisseriaceae bacterium]
MYPFEVYDETTKRVEFYFNLWEDYESNLFKQYPLTSRKRVLLDLINPADRFKDVKTHDWNPHANLGNCYLNNHDCFYCNDDWSVIFDVYPAHNYASTGDSLKFFAELGHENPAGEKIKLLSTSSNIDDDASIRYAYFRNKFWLVSHYKTYYNYEYYEGYILPPTMSWTVSNTCYTSPKSGLKHTFKSTPSKIQNPYVNAFKNYSASISTDTIFYSNETQEWYCKGTNNYIGSYTTLHRGNDLPAIVYANGDKEWWIFGKRHRLDGPAVVYGNKQYFYENGVYLGDQESS